MLSKLAINNNDPLSRRDQGLEFLDVTAQAAISKISSQGGGEGWQRDTYRITNNSTKIIDTHLLVIAKGLPPGTKLADGSLTKAGEPYARVFLPSGVLLPGKSIEVVLKLRTGDDDDDRGRHPQQPPLNYTLNLLSGQGKP